MGSTERMALMSEETEAEVQEEAAEDFDELPEGKKKFSGKKIVLFFVLPLLLLGGVGGAVFYMGLLDSLFGGGEVAEEEVAVESTPADQTGYFMDLDEMLVTLSGSSKKQSFLKMRISLELESASDEDRILAVMPRIVDNFQVFLRELRMDELQGSRGLYRVKEELLARVNAAAHPAKVRDVLFKEMLIQ